jgi:NAD(P)-dependent dehydrogenase (short-subunit alcohol dehydrogenase family)
VNIHAMFYLTKAAVGHMKPGSCIINTASINSDVPNPTLLAYATTKGAIHNFTAGLAQMLAEKGIRANAVAPGPIWTPRIPSILPDDSVKNFGKQVPKKRPGQPVELATAYVMLADPLELRIRRDHRRYRRQALPVTTALQSAGRAGVRFSPKHQPICDCSNIE